MAYDPKDPKDKEIVDGLIKDAVEAREEELKAEHESDVAGLKNNVTRLKDQLQRAKEGKGDDGSQAEITRLETELTAAKSDLSKAIRERDKATRDLDTATKSLETVSQREMRASRDAALTAEIQKAGVAPQFVDAVKALHAGSIVSTLEGEAYSHKVGEKLLGDFFKDWSSGDQGKHYIAAPGNGGGGAGGGGAGAGGTKTMTRSAFDQMSAADKAKFSGEGGTLTEG